jgi:hypothetical protein
VTFQLRIAGANPSFRQTKDSWFMLTAQALDLAKRGYTAVLIERDTPHRGLEIRATKEAITIELFNNSGFAEVPQWIAAAKADLEAQVQRITK